MAATRRLERPSGSNVASVLLLRVRGNGPCSRAGGCGETRLLSSVTLHIHDASAKSKDGGKKSSPRCCLIAPKGSSTSDCDFRINFAAKIAARARRVSPTRAAITGATRSQAPAWERVDTPTFSPQTAGTTARCSARRIQSCWSAPRRSGTGGRRWARSPGRSRGPDTRS
jgi:hypothetical protein